jgi:hypothetical protein
MNRDMSHDQIRGTTEIMRGVIGIEFGRKIKHKNYYYSNQIKSNLN